MDWRNRIIAFGTKPADQFTAHPQNARLHPQIQRAAVKASLDQLGWIAPVIENARTGYLVDGHERVMQALAHNDEVPFVQVELTEAEERTALLIFDPITGLATYDAGLLDELMRSVETDQPALLKLLDDIQQTATLVADELPDRNSNVEFGQLSGDAGQLTLLNWRDIMVTLPIEVYERASAYVDQPQHASRQAAMLDILTRGLDACCP